MDSGRLEFNYTYILKRRNPDERFQNKGPNNLKAWEKHIKYILIWGWDLLICVSAWFGAEQRGDAFSQNLAYRSGVGGTTPSGEAH